MFFSDGLSTMSMAISNSKPLNYQRLRYWMFPLPLSPRSMRSVKRPPSLRQKGGSSKSSATERRWIVQVPWGYVYHQKISKVKKINGDIWKCPKVGNTILSSKHGNTKVNGIVKIIWDLLVVCSACGCFSSTVLVVKCVILQGSHGIICVDMIQMTKT
jgi:hypothetical protein